MALVLHATKNNTKTNFHEVAIKGEARMEYSSGPLDQIDDTPFSSSNLVGEGRQLSMTQSNRSGPLRTVRSKPAFFRSRGSMSEHGSLLSKRVWTLD